MATLHDYRTIINPELNRAKVHKDPNSEYALIMNVEALTMFKNGPISHRRA